MTVRDSEETDGPDRRGRADDAGSLLPSPDLAPVLLQVYDRTDNAVAIAGDARRILWVNRAFERLTGRRAADVVGLDLRDALLGPAPPSPARDALDQAIGRCRPAILQLLSEHALGHPFWAALDLQPLTMAEDGRRCFVAIMRDVTRDVMDRSLARARAAMLTALSDGAETDAILTAMLRALQSDGPGRQLSIMLRTDRNTLTCPAHTGLPEDYVAAIADLPIGDGIGSCGTAAHTGGRYIAADIHTDPNWADHRDAARKSGARACWSQAIVGEKGRVHGTFAIYYDRPRGPSEQETALIERAADLAREAIERRADAEVRRRAEREMALSHERLALAKEIAGLGVWEVLIDEGRVLLDSRVQDIHGLDGGADWAWPEAMERLIHPEDRARLKAIFDAAIARGDGYETELRILRPDGSIGHVQAAARVLTDDDGTPVRVLGVTRDVSARVEAERALHASKQAAEAANAAKSEFLATMSHELRTPLNAVIGFSDVLRQELFGPLGVSRYRSYAEDIHSSSEHLLSLINDTLELSRLERGGADLDLRPVPVRVVAHEALRTMRIAARKRGVRLRAAIPHDVTPIRADRRAVVQILLNLLSNAVKFTPEGRRVVLRVLDADRDARPGFVRLCVEDEGVGVPRERLALLGAPFQSFSVDGADPASRGVGLGLAISMRLARAMHGVLALESEEGRGARALLDLPAAERRAGPTQDAGTAISGRAGD